MIIPWLLLQPLFVYISSFCWRIRRALQDEVLIAFFSLSLLSLCEERKVYCKNSSPLIFQLRRNEPEEEIKYSGWSAAADSDSV
jgi:hypothetical protein